MLLGATILLALGGLVMIYSASMGSDSVSLHDSAYHLKRQAGYILAGLLVLWICSRVPLRRIRSAAWPVWWISIAGLVAVLLIGASRGGATRWIDLGILSPQPSEFAKMACVMLVAAMLVDRQKDPRPLSEDAWRLALIVGVPFGLVMLQPDMGTAMSLAIAIFLVLVIGGLRWRYVAPVVVAAALAIPVMIFAKPYRASRFLAFLDPASDPLKGGYQITQAMLAFGSGGIAGVGLGLSRQKYFYLPAAHTDFIFAIIGEELGLIGTLLVVVVFGVLAWAGFKIAASARDRYARLIAAGLTITIIIQAVINMASVTGLMPVTGIPLPLVSYGGSSMLFTMGCVGLILSVAREGRTRPAAGVRAADAADEEKHSARDDLRRRNGGARVSVTDRGGASARRRAL